MFYIILSINKMIRKVKKYVNCNSNKRNRKNTIYTLRKNIRLSILKNTCEKLKLFSIDENEEDKWDNHRDVDWDNHISDWDNHEDADYK